jgi:guanylate kinase
MLTQPAFVISAPSGTGKGSLISKLMQKERGLRLARSWTTRPPRPGDGHKYRYVSHQEFMQAVSEGKFLEWQPVFDHFYGTSLAEVRSDEQLIVEIDTKGALELKERYPKFVYTTFIVPPSLAELERRLRERNTNSDEEISKRLAAAPAEIAQAHRFDSWIENDNLDSAFGKLQFLIMSRRNGMLRHSPVYTNPMTLDRVKKSFATLTDSLPA